MYSPYIGLINVNLFIYTLLYFRYAWPMRVFHEEGLFVNSSLTLLRAIKHITETNASIGYYCIAHKIVP